MLCTSDAPLDAKSLNVGKGCPVEQDFAEFHVLQHHFCNATCLAAVQWAAIA
jgi:hypothetical protein